MSVKRDGAGASRREAGGPVNFSFFSCVALLCCLQIDGGAAAQLSRALGGR